MPQVIYKVINFLKKVKRQFDPIGFVKTIIPSIKAMWHNGIPSYILYFGESIGDNLMLTVLAKELYVRGHKNIWIKCDHADLYKNNPYIKLVVPLNTPFSNLLLHILGVKMVHPIYTEYQNITDKDSVPEKHIILKMADCVGLKGEITIRPNFFLDEKEAKKGQYAENQIVITTSASSARVFMRNKEWYADRLQQLADRLSKNYQIIQLGAAGDNPLNNVLDLRGQTTIRESAAILKNSRLLVSHVGFMMHLARAVDCSSVIIYGGREKPEQSGYSCFSNIYNPVECAPCWQHNLCNFNRKCMDLISVDKVEKAAINQLQNNAKPMPTDILINE